NGEPPEGPNPPGDSPFEPRLSDTRRPRSRRTVAGRRGRRRFGGGGRRRLSVCRLLPRLRRRLRALDEPLDLRLSPPGLLGLAGGLLLLLLGLLDLLLQRHPFGDGCGQLADRSHALLVDPLGLFQDCLLCLISAHASESIAPLPATHAHATGTTDPRRVCAEPGSIAKR